MEKRNNKYRIYLQELELTDGTPSDKSLEFEFNNHDNIFSIIENMEERQLFENKADDVEFIIGLKLFSEVMIRNRNHPLFEELAPAFKNFMMKLKKGV